MKGLELLSQQPEPAHYPLEQNTPRQAKVQRACRFGYQTLKKVRSTQPASLQGFRHSGVFPH